MDQSQKQHQEQTQDLHQIQTQVTEIGDKVDQVLSLLTGNELDKEGGGMIKTVKDHEDRIDVLERKIDRFVYLLIGASALGGYGLIEFLTKVFTKGTQ